MSLESESQKGKVIVVLDNFGRIQRRKYSSMAGSNYYLSNLIDQHYHQPVEKTIVNSRKNGN